MLSALVRPPNPQEVATLWACCAPVTTDEEVCKWLGTVGVDARAVRVRDLARVLSEEVILPGWARYGRDDWRTGNYRLILPLHDLDGHIRHLYARALRPLGTSQRVGTSPPVSGIPGLLMANDVARSLLRQQPEPTWHAWPTVVVTGGAIDFLDWSSSYHEQTGPAVL